MNNGYPDNKYLALSRSNGTTKPPTINVRRPDQPEAGQNAPNALWEYLAVAKRRKLILFLSTLVGTIAGFIVLLYQPPVYLAQMTLELQGFNEAFMHLGEIDPQAGTGNYSSGTSNMNTEIKIIESKSVRNPVTIRMFQESTPLVKQPRDWVDKMRLRVHRGAVDPLQEMKDGILLATRTLGAKPVTGTRIIAVSCESTVPEIAANFVNNIATEFMTLNTGERTATAQRTAQWLDNQVAETTVNLEAAQKRLDDFERRSPLVFQGAGDSETLNNHQLSSLTQALGSIKNDRVAKESRYELLKTSDPNSIPDVVDNPRIRDDKQKLEEAEAQKAQDLKKYTEQHQKVIADTKVIETLQHQIQQEIAAVVQRIKDDYENTIRQEQTLTAEYKKTAMAVSGQSESVSEHSLLRKEVDIYKGTLNNMLNQVNTAAMVAALPANNFRIVDQAFTPGFPSKPVMSDYLAAGGITGFGLAFALVLLKERLNKRKQTLTFSAPGYASSVLSLPELGVIPSAEYEAEQSRKNGRRRHHTDIIPKEVAVPGSFGMGLSAVTQYGKATLLAESFRLTVTSLMLMSRHNKPLKVIVVTSPGPGEGKTTISSNIAVGMAEAGLRILVIDMDLRRPRMHTLFDLPNDHGLCDLIRSKEPLQTAETGLAITSTKIPGLSVLTSGKVDAGSISEIFHSPRMPVLLRQLQDSYDIVLVDTPPVLQFSESRLVASLADGVILVLRSGVTDKTHAVMARDQLAVDGIEVIGTILNDWDPDSAGSSKYTSYYNAYMSYHQQDEAK